MDLLGALSQGSPSNLNSSTTEPPLTKCSRKGCQRQGQWKVLWNNPKIHTPERRKVWLACDEHREYLEHFLASRDFWKNTEAISTD